METPRVLAQIALDRARIIAPFTLVGVITSALLSEPVGIPLTAPVIACNLFAIVVLVAGCVALFRRRVPVRYGHVALASLWWVAVACTVVSGYFSGALSVTLLVLVEVMSAAIFLQTRLVIVSFAALDAVWIPILARTSDPHVSLYTAILVLAEIFALLFQRLHRNALLRAETHRHVQEKTVQQFEHQLAELARSEREREILHEQLLHAQRLEATGTLAAGLAHDMNNILGSIMNIAELMRDDATPESQGDVSQIIAQAERGAELTRGLLAFSRRGQYRKQVMELDVVLGDVLPILSRTLPKQVELDTDLAANGAHIEGDPVQLHQAIVNLSMNASDAMAGAGKLEIHSERAKLSTEAAGLGVEPGPYAKIRVRDTGTGMDADTRRRVFEPFFTTKPIGKGTGLGLSTVWGIIKNHGGAVTVESERGRGTTFTLYLPITAAAPGADAAFAASTGLVTTRTTVLVVDDEAQVRSTTMRLLRRRGLDVLGAGNGEEALRVYAEHEGSIGLVILDMAMPVMGGLECFRKLRETSAVPVLIATGYAIEADAQALVAEGAVLLEKPFPASVLIREVKRLIAQAPDEALAVGDG